ncbi:uncharacterized protein BT62DRAFT_1005476 [Guyanagaster necrorhizus]|uniref:Uncharacterized protein n=1 Tax=Guyanagaster necrorhizus TaxID=856835 RepID=A0A9P7VUX4_9AGAR|nr:uncharacterized protein BT62DRAFT_1005476 [Guyanagaster necrorhizus MCA 3950]KAG7447068.1 hypothetical protein BT62DRAFT_1005476 [Guyanagaster necrorhizus MCA 3950]
MPIKAGWRKDIAYRTDARPSSFAHLNTDCLDRLPPLPFASLSVLNFRKRDPPLCIPLPVTELPPLRRDGRYFERNRHRTLIGSGITAAFADTNIKPILRPTWYCEDLARKYNFMESTPWPRHLEAASGFLPALSVIRRHGQRTREAEDERFEINSRAYLLMISEGINMYANRFVDKDAEGGWGKDGLFKYDCYGLPEDRAQEKEQGDYRLHGLAISTCLLATNELTNPDALNSQTYTVIKRSHRHDRNTLFSMAHWLRVRKQTDRTKNRSKQAMSPEGMGPRAGSITEVMSGDEVMSANFQFNLYVSRVNCEHEKGSRT